MRAAGNTRPGLWLYDVNWEGRGAGPGALASWSLERTLAG